MVPGGGRFNLPESFSGFILTLRLDIFLLRTLANRKQKKIKSDISDNINQALQGDW